MIRSIFLLSLICVFGLLACRNDPGTPRPRAYPRIEYPAVAYTVFDTVSCPFTFDYPAYAEIKSRPEDCWFDIYLPVFQARIHCSYLPVGDRADFDKLVRDAFIIASKINERANYMEEMRVRNAQGVGGLSLQWTGPAASPVHFFLSDTTAHFFKGALYFDAQVRPDSLAPIVEFIQRDMDHLISSFAWKK